VSVNKLQELYELTKKIYDAVNVIRAVNAHKLYRDLKSAIESWMKDVDAGGVIIVDLLEDEQFSVSAVFDFRNKKFEIEYGKHSDPYFTLGFAYLHISPIWIKDFYRVLIFFAKIDEVVRKLEEAYFNTARGLKNLADLVKSLKEEIYPKLERLEDDLVSRATKLKLEESIEES
jgi:hypothetical protein